MMFAPQWHLIMIAVVSVFEPETGDKITNIFIFVAGLLYIIYLPLFTYISVIPTYDSKTP